MLEWSTPSLLLLLPMVLLLRWLHRHRQAQFEVVVPALFLWSIGEADATKQKRSRKPDPRWRLRAAIAALLVTAASGPAFMRTRVRAVDVYFDDSPSMGTQEVGGSRVQLAVHDLVHTLEQSGADELRVISLGHRGRTLVLDPRESASWPSQIERWVDLQPRAGLLPAVAQLRQGSEHWIVTDGVDAAVADWVREVPIQHVTWVGKETENAAVTRLAVRPCLQEPQWLRGIVRVTNGGIKDVRRRLQVVSGDGTVFDEVLDLAPGEVSQRAFDLRTPEGGALRARISPSDALPDDDEITVQQVSMPTVRVRVGPRCDSYLRTAVRLHPALTVVEDASSALIVWCSDLPPPVDKPALWVRAGGATVAREMMLAGASGTAPFVIEHTGVHSTIEVRLGMEFPTWLRQPGNIAFLSALFDRALDRSLLDRTVSVGRPEAAARIVPEDLRREAAAPPTNATNASLDLSGLALLLAGFLLVVDTLRSREPR